MLNLNLLESKIMSCDDCDAKWDIRDFPIFKCPACKNNHVRFPKLKPNVSAFWCSCGNLELVENYKIYHTIKQIAYHRCGGILIRITNGQ